MISDGLVGNRAAWELTRWSPWVMKCTWEGERERRRAEGRKKKERRERNDPVRQLLLFGNSLLNAWFSWGSCGPTLSLCALDEYGSQGGHDWSRTNENSASLHHSGLSDGVQAELLKETLTLKMYLKKRNKQLLSPGDFCSPRNLRAGVVCVLTTEVKPSWEWTTCTRRRAQFKDLPTAWFGHWSQPCLNSTLVQCNYLVR